MKVAKITQYVTLATMLKIRLQRTGKRGQAYFKVIVTEHTTRPKGKYLELLGSYDPHKKEMKVEGERIKYWISKGAGLSATANNLLVDRKVIEGQKVQSWKPRASKKQKTAAAAPVGPVNGGSVTAESTAPAEVLAQ